MRFGDLSPFGSATRCVAIFFIPVGVAVVSPAIGNVSNTFVEGRMDRANKKFLLREVTLRDLEKNKSRWRWRGVNARECKFYHLWL